MIKKIALAGALLAPLALVGCVDDTHVASRNLSKAADNFEAPRHIVCITSDHW